MDKKGELGGHTALVIGYDVATSYVYTVDGNTGGESGERVDYRKFKLSELRDDSTGAFTTFGENGGFAVASIIVENAEDTTNYRKLQKHPNSR